MLYVCSAASPTRWRRTRLVATTPLSMARSSSSTAVQRPASSFSSRRSTLVRPTAVCTTSDAPTALMAASMKPALTCATRLNGIGVGNGELGVLRNLLADDAELLDDR